MSCKKALLYIFSVLFSVLTYSCSLDYFENEDATSTSPEFVFFDANFTRKEDNKQNVTMSVLQLEQYNQSGLTYAKNTSFTLYDTNQEITVVGTCDLLSADTDIDIYSFLGNVSIVSYEHDAEVQADNLRWLGDEELFIGAKDENVSIVIGGNSTQESSSEDDKVTELYIEGSGFSAKGLDFSYSFEGPVTGRIIEK